MNRNKILCLFTALFVFVACKGQQLGERLSQTSVMIYNNSNEKLKFNLGVQHQVSKVYNIREHEKFIAGPFPVNSMLLFSIGTGNIQKKYLLKLNNTYMIFWNSAANHWDMRRIINNEQ